MRTRPAAAALIAAALMACSAESPEPNTSREAVSLDGRTITFSEESTSSRDGAVETTLTAGGESIAVVLSKDVLTIHEKSRSLALRRSATGTVATFDTDARGEHAEIQITEAATTTAARAHADARGHVVPSALERHAVALTAAIRAIETWPSTERDAADALLGSFIASLPRTEASVVRPQAIFDGDVAFAFEGGGGDCSTACAIMMPNKGGCSVTCSGGCAVCTEGGDAISCTCR